MAEFQEVMKNWERMCDSCHEYCELFDELCPSVPNILLNFDENDAATIERVVMKWAADHPIFPTWYEYLTDMYPAAWDMIKDKPIPTDIAQMLGLEPKEG